MADMPSDRGDTMIPMSTAAQEASRASEHLWLAHESLEALLIDAEFPDKYDPITTKLITDMVSASAQYMTAMAEAYDGS